jgi:type IV pilus assembly protein PilX
MTAKSERGMALLVSLVFLLLLTLIGISSMQNATLQEKMAGSATLRNQSFQSAESALRVGEIDVQRPAYSLPDCLDPCLPPADSSTVVAAGLSGSGVTWIAAGNGFYGVQKLKSYITSAADPTLYRVTAVGLAGHSRSVLESIYAKY